MIMKGYILILLICLIGCTGNVSKDVDNGKYVETIPFDVKKHEMKIGMDISYMLDTSYFEIIPLETNNNCLIAEISNLYLINDKIVIYDEMAKGAYIFNRDGSYHAKVRAVGQGPGEYPNFVNDVNASDNYIGVLNPLGIMLYNYNGKYEKTISLHNLWGRKIFTFDEEDYFLVNDWSMNFNMDASVLVHFFKIDSKNNQLFYFIPFSLKDINNQRGWGVKRFYSLYNDTALFYWGSCDTLYSVNSNGEVSPRYFIDIIHDKLPEEIRKGDGTKAMIYAANNNKVLGILDVMETPRYLFLTANEGRIAIYDKQKKETIAIAGSFMVPQFWDELQFIINFSSREGDMVIAYLDGYNAFNINKYIAEQKSQKKWELGDGITPFQKELFRITKDMRDEEDNPILLIFKMKDER